MSVDKDDSGEVSRYEFSGIEERHGAVPAWLAVVYLCLFVWMFYYLMAYWTDKG